MTLEPFEAVFPKPPAAIFLPSTRLFRGAESWVRRAETDNLRTMSLNDARVAELLDRVESALSELGSPATQHLRPGASVETIRGQLRSVGLRSDPDLEALLTWHDGTSLDGTSPLGHITLFPGFYLQSIAEAAEMYGEFKSDKRWRKGWLPLLADGGGDFFVVELQRFGRGTRVRRFRIEESEHPLEYMSISDMVRTMAAALDEKIIFLDSDGFLEMNDEEYASLAARENPSVKWWRA